MGIIDIFKRGKNEGKQINFSGKKVLVVEDERFLRDVCRNKLTKQGFKVFEAVDGEEALHEVIKIKPDIILLDIILPYMDGFEVIEKIRNSPNREIVNIPIVVMSNLGEKNDIDKAMGLGADDYLVKAEFTVDEIINKLIKYIK